MMGALLLPVVARANDDSRALVRTPEPQQVSLVVGKSTVVDTPVAIKRASLADPQVADAIVLSPSMSQARGMA
jgi:Flp pilus assembly secretin CpaC